VATAFVTPPTTLVGVGSKRHTPAATCLQCSPQSRITRDAPSIAKLIAPELIISSGNHNIDDVGKWLAITR
jgi:hypothetical protein